MSATSRSPSPTPTPTSTRARSALPTSMRWVCALPGFADDPARSGEKILEAIQMAWIDEA